MNIVEVEIEIEIEIEMNGFFWGVGAEVGRQSSRRLTANPTLYCVINDLPGCRAWFVVH